MRVWNVIGVCTIGVASVAPATAQTPPLVERPAQSLATDRPLEAVGPPLSLAAAVDEAVRSNAALAALRRSSDVAHARPASVQSLPPPIVNAQIWQWPIDTLNPANVNMYMFTIGQDLPGRGKRDLRAAAMQADADLAANDVTIAANRMLADLKEVYTALVLARKTDERYREGARVLRALADATETRYAAGQGAAEDVLRPAAALSKLTDDLISVRETAELAAARLNTFIGRSIDAPIGPLDELSSEWQPPADDELMRLVIEHQPDLQARKLALDRAQAQVAIAKSDLKPDYTVQGGYMLLPHGTDAWTAQVGMTWPSAPWSRGGTQARIAEASAEVNAAGARITEARATLTLALQEALIGVRTAQARLSVLQTTVVPQARQSLEASRLAYEAGRTSLTAVLDNQRRVLDEELDVIRALASFASARAQLERVVGVDLVAGGAR